MTMTSGTANPVNGAMIESSGSGPNVNFTAYTVGSGTPLNAADGVAVDKAGDVWTDGSNGSGTPVLWRYAGTNYIEYSAGRTYANAGWKSFGELAIGARGTVFDAATQYSDDSLWTVDRFFYLEPGTSIFTAGPSGQASGLAAVFGQVTTGADGRVWYTAPYDTTPFGDPVPGVLGYVTPQAATTIAIPNSTNPLAVTVGPDRDLWVSVSTSSGYAFDRFTTSGTFLGALPTAYQANNATTGPDGNVWYLTTNQVIGRITPAGVNTTYFVGSPYSLMTITIGSDGALWFSIGPPVDEIGRITTAGAVTEYSFPASLGVDFVGQIIGAREGCSANTLFVGTNVGPVELMI
jgi:hypothetical protein